MVPYCALGLPVTARHQRIGAKIRAARRLLESLPAADSRVRLLRCAILRRDEILLDGLLAEYRAHWSPISQVRLLVEAVGDAKQLLALLSPGLASVLQLAAQQPPEPMVPESFFSPARLRYC
jgi:hypothetical protein